jgi:hypothetical protein
MMSIIDPRYDLGVLDAAGQAPKPRSSGLTLWAPDIVLVKTIEPVPDRRTILPGEPGLRPAAVKAQIEAAWTVLETLTEGRDRLGLRAAAAEARATGAGSEREHVAAVMESYRVKTELDELLRGTTRTLTALVQERGPR